MKYVYAFQEGNQKMRELLGGKGANLAEMTGIGLPVPSGFTVTTTACKKYYEEKETLGNEIIDEIKEQLNNLEKRTGKKLGDPKNPLLVSVRSGARESMPGMMDTVLNLGMNDEVAEDFAKITNNERFIYDSYRRLIQMFADVVMDFPKEAFEGLFEKIKEEKKVEKDTELTTEDLKEVIKRYKEQYRKHANCDFPEDPITQLIEAIKAVFRSWNTERAKTYRRLNQIPDEWGTAVNVQEMVYGNKGNTSGTGVAFTRDPATGEKKLFGEFLINAQGEDVVAGIRTPKSIDKLKEILPECYQEFQRICDILEKHYKDMQDMEFTIEEGKLFMLQTRNGKRTGKAAVKIAVNLVEEGLITKEEALMRVDAKQLDQLLHKTFKEQALKTNIPLTKGLAASPGAAVGKIYFSAEDIIKANHQGEKDLILVRLETSPEDIEGMNLAHGILTMRGGMTSHAAVVARGMGTCCISGCEAFHLDQKKKTLTIGNTTLKEGDYLSLDGSTGNVYEGCLEVEDANISGDFKTFLTWADQIRSLEIRCNAETVTEAEKSLKFGAEGIGLCRTEHMFFEEERILNFRKMICAKTKEEREKSLEDILPYQKEDFIKLFRIMKGKEVTIRLLDPPLHEFLPKTVQEKEKLAQALHIDITSLEKDINSLKEFNPMMGHRGCRLDITYPEIAKMQTKAIIEAAITIEQEGEIVTPEIMIPLVSEVKEFRYVKEIIKKEADQILQKSQSKLTYKIGTMIELPRAALMADEIAKEADFFSFGTNDLTQFTYGFSRDDASKFLNSYYEKKILEEDPFISIDQKGVGELVKTGAYLGRKSRKDITLGICGEHGGDPKSIDFCHRIGLNYVSCSPYRIPIAKLAAAQAAIKSDRQ